MSKSTSSAIWYHKSTATRSGNLPSLYAVMINLNPDPLGPPVSVLKTRRSTIMPRSEERHNVLTKNVALNRSSFKLYRTSTVHIQTPTETSRVNPSIKVMIIKYCSQVKISAGRIIMRAADDLHMAEDCHRCQQWCSDDPGPWWFWDKGDRYSFQN